MHQSYLKEVASTQWEELSYAEWERTIIKILQLRFPKGSSKDSHLRKELALRKLILKDAFEGVLPTVAPPLLLRLQFATDTLTKSFNRLATATRRQLEGILENKVKNLSKSTAKKHTPLDETGRSSKPSSSTGKKSRQSNHRVFRPAEQEIVCEWKTQRGDMFKFCREDDYRFPTFKAIELDASRGDTKSVLLQNEGQAFDSQATKWEKKFCTPIGSRLFIPVVDRKGVVVGWFRRVVAGDELYTPVSDTPASKVSPDQVVYIPDAPDATQMKWTGLQALGPGGSGGERFEVLFDTHGSILYLQSVGGRGSSNWGPDGIFMEDDLFDKVSLIGGAAPIVKSLVVRLGKGGLKLLARRVPKIVDDIADDVAKEMAGKLMPLARKRGASKYFSGKEMRKFLRETFDRNPHLARLHRAQSMSGQAQHKELLEILESWEHYTGKTVQVVKSGAVEEAGAMGKAGFARNAETGKEVLAIEESVFKNTDELRSQVTHELAYDAVRSANGVPSLTGEFPHRMAHDLLELMIEEGPEGWLKVIGELP